MLLALNVPAGNERGPIYMDQALAAIHQGNTARLPIALEYGIYRGSVTLFCRFPDELQPIVASQLYAHYPDARIKTVPEGGGPLLAGHYCWSAELTLSPTIFPIKRYSQFDDALNRLTADPLTAILTALATDATSPLSSHIAIAIRPARRRFYRRAQRCLKRLASPFFRAHHRLAHLYLHLALSPHVPVRVLGWFLGRLGKRHEASAQSDPLHTSASHAHEREQDVQAASDKLGRHLFEATIRLTVAGPEDLADTATRKLRQLASAFGVFHAPGLASFHLSRIGRGQPRRSPASAFLLSNEELATLWHPATLTVRAPTMTPVLSREFEPPVDLPTVATHPQLTVLGSATFRGRETPFGILPDDRLRHIAILGKTGMGKSTLLQRLLTSDIASGQGVALIDPHGDLIEAILPAIPSHRSNDVILFDAGDTTHPIAFNVLACSRPEQRALIASGVVSAFYKLYGESWGPRLEYILHNALLALLEIPGSTLVSILQLLGDAAYRKDIVRRLADPVVRNYWEHEFAAMPPKLQAEAIAPIQNKVGAFVSSPLLRNLVGQAKSSVDFRSVLDTGKVLLVNVSKGRIGDDASALLGSLLVTSLQLAAMSRADIPEHERRHFYLYVDEFQNFATDSFATILSEARKYRLALTIANQYLAQMEEATAAAVFGNVGTLVTFQLGAQDTELIAAQLAGDVQPTDLIALPRYQALVRLLIDGMPSRPFSMRTLPPITRQLDPKRAASIRRYCRQRYGRPAAQVQADIHRALARR